MDRSAGHGLLLLPSLHGPTFNRKFEDLFGESAAGEAACSLPKPRAFRSISETRRRTTTNCAKLNQHYADIAASIQKVTEELLLGMAKNLQQATGMKKLCMAGGVGLNSVANSRILRETGFEELYIQPAAGDGGGALGAALVGLQHAAGQAAQLHDEACLLGTRELRGGDQRFPDARTIFRIRRLTTKTSCWTAWSDDLTSAKVVGWSQGRFEWGPRALGSRSILADPRNPQMKDIVNAKIKFREPYRPFAPSVLAESAEKYFDLPNAMQALSGALHAVCGAGKAGSGKRRCRRSHTSMEQAACRPCSRKKARAITS